MLVVIEAAVLMAIEAFDCLILQQVFLLAFPLLTSPTKSPCPCDCRLACRLWLVWTGFQTVFVKQGKIIDTRVNFPPGNVFTSLLSQFTTLRSKCIASAELGSTFKKTTKDVCYGVFRCHKNQDFQTIEGGSSALEPQYLLGCCY